MRVTSLDFAEATKYARKGAHGVVKFDSVLGLYAMADNIMLQGLFEALVYVFNLYLIFKTSEPLEMVCFDQLISSSVSSVSSAHQLVRLISLIRTPRHQLVRLTSSQAHQAHQAHQLTYSCFIGWEPPPLR